MSVAPMRRPAEKQSSIYRVKYQLPDGFLVFARYPDGAHHPVIVNKISHPAIDTLP